MSRNKRLFRVTAVYENDFGEYTRVWHYQDKRAAESRAKHCREGRSEVWISEETNEPAGFIESPAKRVELTRSAPIVWEVSA